MEPLKTAYVKIWGEVVGAVFWDSTHGYAIFEYEPSFLTKGWDLSPIHMGLLTAQRGEREFFFPNIDPHTFNGLPGLLASALPDDFGNDIIDSWLVRNGRPPHSFNPVERLCYVGTRGMGALEFAPQIGPAKLNKTVPIEILNIMNLAQEALTTRTRLDATIKGADKERADAMLDILRVGTTAGGAVPKAIIAMNKENRVISGQSEVPEGYEHWILKFDGVSIEHPHTFGVSKDDCRVEYAYYLMARDAGVNMTECRLLEENGRAHFLTKRFDRIGNKKIHVLSLAGMAHFGWNPVGKVGYEDAFQTMRRLKLPYPDQEQQFRRMIFNAVTKNTDDHVKNISYMLKKDGAWELSPAYDVTFTYDRDELLGDRHKMKINGRQKNFTMEDFLEVAENMEIKRAEDIINQILESVEQWPDFAKQAGVRQTVTEYIASHHLDGEQLDPGLSLSP
jgi:serine/threonine-protein kinase HipA